MALQKRFLRKGPDSVKISKGDMLTGLSVGICFAVCFYLWLYGMREVFRIQSINEYNEIIVLSRQEVRFYNLFTAFLATVTGQSVCFLFLACRHRIRRGRLTRRAVISVMNDLSNLLSVFMLWFLGIVLTLSVFFVFTFGGYEIGIFIEYKLYFILVIIVLFLNQWLSVRRIFGNRSLKWMLISAVVISGISFGLSRIDPVPYDKINESVLEHSIYSRVDIDLPVIAHLEPDFGYWRFNIADIYLIPGDNGDTPDAYVLDKLSQTPHRIIETDWEGLMGVVATVDSLKYDYMGESEWGRMLWGLKIDKDTPMEYVKALKRNLAAAGIVHIVLAVLPEEMDGHTPRYYEDNSPLRFNIQPFVAARESYQAELRRVNDNFPNRTYISHGQPGKYTVDGVEYDLAGFGDKMYELTGYEGYMIIYDIPDNVNYQEYINVIANIKYSLERRRREYILLRSGSSSQRYEELYREAMEIYPFRLFELVY